MIIKPSTREVNSLMEQSVFEHAGQQIDDTTHKATRAASAVADALEDSVIAARRVARDGADAATELLYNARRRFERHPFETAAITFAAGIAAGTAIGWMLKRGKSTATVRITRRSIRLPWLGNAVILSTTSR